MTLFFVTASHEFSLEESSRGKTMQEVLPAWAFRGLLHAFGWLGSLYPLPPMTLKPRRFELEIGDATG